MQFSLSQTVVTIREQSLPSMPHRISYNVPGAQMSRAAEARQTTRGSLCMLGEGGTFVGTSRVIIGKLRSGQISGSGSCWKITFVIIIFRKN